MNYKNIGIRLKKMLLSPGEAWKEIAGEQQEGGMHPVNQFALPMIAAVAVCSFLNLVINNEKPDFSVALREATIIFTAFYAGLFAGAYLLKTVAEHLYKLKFSLFKCLQVLAYSSVCIYLIEFAHRLIPALFFLFLFMPVIIFPLYYGVKTVFQLNGKQQTSLIIVAMVGCLGTPYLISYILRFLMSILG